MASSSPARKPAPRKPAPRKPAPRKAVPRVEETSAGGFVLDTSGAHHRAALIARRDRRGRLVWSLPKGHIEPGETAEQAAVREVFEETGIHGTILAGLGTIDFWFMSDRKRIHKTVHHFVLAAHDVELSDADAEVAEVAWVPLDDVADRLHHAAERRLVPRVHEVLADRAKDCP